MYNSWQVRWRTRTQISRRSLSDNNNRPGFTRLERRIRTKRVLRAGDGVLKLFLFKFKEPLRRTINNASIQKIVAEGVRGKKLVALLE
jgi:hypothetical protein